MRTTRYRASFPKIPKARRRETNSSNRARTSSIRGPAIGSPAIRSESPWPPFVKGDTASERRKPAQRSRVSRDVQEIDVCNTPEPDNNRPACPWGE